MSNSNRWLYALGFVAGLMFLSGCASRPPQPPLAPPSNPPLAIPGDAAMSEKPSVQTNDTLESAAAEPVNLLPGGGWSSLFDGRTLSGWRQTPFAGRGEVECRSGLLVLNMGDPFTGVNLTNDFPKMNYEVGLEAMRLMGSDFFCGLTVPVGDSFCSLIVGGWGGSLVGISSLDDMDASENETTKYVGFKTGRWYLIRLRVTQGRLEAWLDDKKLVDVNTAGKRISLRPGDIEMSKPFGLACWETTGAFRQIKMRRVDGPADPPKKQY